MTKKIVNLATYYLIIQSIVNGYPQSGSGTGTEPLEHHPPTHFGGIYDPVVQVDLDLNAGVPGEDIPGLGEPAPGQGWGGGSGSGSGTGDGGGGGEGGGGGGGGNGGGGSGNGNPWWSWWINIFFPNQNQNTSGSDDQGSGHKVPWWDWWDKLFPHDQNTSGGGHGHGSSGGTHWWDWWTNPVKSFWSLFFPKF